MKRTLLLAGRCGSTGTALPSCTRVCRTTTAAWRVPLPRAVGPALFPSVRSTATVHGSPQQQHVTTGGSTVDEEEVQRLSESARLRWWDPEGEMKPLHRMNPKRVAYLRTCLTKRLGLPPLAPQPFAGLRFLDVGCGPGLLTEVFLLPHTFPPTPQMQLIDARLDLTWCSSRWRGWVGRCWVWMHRQPTYRRRSSTRRGIPRCRL